MVRLIAKIHECKGRQELYVRQKPAYILQLHQNGYEVGKYISIEKQIEKTKDVYYDVQKRADAGWHEGTNDPTPFIRYMLQVILACYVRADTMPGEELKRKL